MKKISIILAALCIFSAVTVASSAAASKKEEFVIPYAVTAPTIDGEIGDGEWDNALVRDLTAADVDEPTNKGAKFEGATFYWMWDEEGLYFLAEVNDKTPMKTPFAPGSGSYNAKDGVQISIYGDDKTTGSTAGTLLFYSFAPTSTDGSALIGEHFCYGTGSAGKDVPASEGDVAATYGKTGYVIEGFIAKEGLAKPKPAVDFKAGASIPLANIVLDEYDGATTAIFTDTAWFSGVESNKYILSEDETAGYVEVADAPAGAPATFDAVTLAGIAAAASAFAAYVSKKRK